MNGTVEKEIIKSSLRGYLFSLLLLFISALPTQAAQREVDQVAGILGGIIDVCQSEGMLACEKNFKGADLLFDYIRMFAEVEQYDRAYKKFLRDHYPDNSGFDFYVLRASLNLAMDITFSREQFIAKIRDVAETDRGYALTMDTGETVSLDNHDGTWVFEVPPRQAEQLKSLENFYQVGRIKKWIIIYRTMEADLAGLSKKQLQDNISHDLAPFIVALFGKEKFPEIVRYLVTDTDSVLAFYNRFSSREDMERHIRQTLTEQSKGQ